MRRFAIYLFFDSEGIVDDYVTYKLEKLREHVETIVVVANEPLGAEGRRRLEAVADEVLIRPNEGYDVGAYRHALSAVGFDRLAEFDELVLLNYTFFGPVSPFGDLFERMEATAADFWGLTDHRSVKPNPFRNAPDPYELPEHIQSTWIAIRQRMLTSPEFADYWRTMPEITSYDDSVLLHEARFTQHFESLGFTSAVAFPQDRYPSGNASLDHADLLLDDGCPMVKRRTFFMDPVHMEHEAVIGRRMLEKLEASGYPMRLVWQNLSRTTLARTIQANLSLLEVMSEHDAGGPAVQSRVVVIAHIFYLDMADEILAHVLNIPGGADLVVTTDTEAKAISLREELGGRVAGALDVRVVPSNDGRDVSAFLITCADVLAPGRYDLVCKIHTKRSPQDGYNRATAFKEYLFDNLLGSPGYVGQLLRLFDDPTLGAVFPPVVNIGYPTLGHAWFTNFDGAQKWAAALGIDVPLDKTTPMAPLGSMFWARPEALRPLVEPGFTWDDFAGDGHYGDGSVPHIVERLFGYAVLSQGYHVRNVLTTRWAGIAYSFLEYRLQLISSMLPAYTGEQVHFIEDIKDAADNPLVWLRRRMGLRHPRLGTALRPIYRSARWGFRGLRAVVRRAVGAGGRL